MVTACALIDIKSAFDTAWAPAILLALIKRKWPFFLIKIIKDFLTGRKGKFDQQQTDEPFQFPTGCPQGSLLSPFLWNILIDDILHLPAESKLYGWILAYADDISTTLQHKDETMAVRLLQQLIDLIKSRLEMLKLRANAAKTVLIIFSWKRTSTKSTVIN
jgi:hypothetical protein